MASGSLTDTLRETFALFQEAGAPQTTPEVADRLGLGRRSTYNRLERLVEHGRLETKKVGANARVWWRPSTETDASVSAGSAAAASLVDVLDDAEVGVFVLDETFDVAWINAATERYFGLDREQVLGRDKRQLVDERIVSVVDDAETFAETVLSTYDDNTYTEHFQCHVTPGDGREERWLEHRSKPIRAGAYAGGRVELYYDITAQKRSEQARHEDRAQFESLIDTVEEYAIFMLDTGGNVRTWNPGAEQIKGYDANDILGEHVSMFYTDAARAAGVPEANLAAAANQGSIEDEGWRVREDGSRFWANVTITAIRDDDGDLQGYAKVTRDMTDRYEYEQQLERQRDDLEQELDAIFERIDDAFYALDREFRFNYVNDSAETYLGKSQGDLLGRTVWEALDIDEDDPIVETFETAMATQEPTQFEHYSDPLGIWVTVSVYPSSTGLSVYFREITERKERERELAQYETLFTESKDVNVIVESDGTFRSLTPSTSDVFGYEPEELVGEVGFDYIHPDDREEALAEFTKMIDTPGYEPEIEFRFEHADGSWIVLDALARDLREAPDIEGVVVYTRDVTERKQREQELERQREQLAALNNLNDVVRNITDAVIEQSTREEIETIVCGRLAESDSYEFAWIAEVDPHTQTLSPRIEAGVDGYLEEIPLSTDPDEPAGQGPAGRAIRTREIQTTHDALTDPNFALWREHAKEYGYRSSAGIPIVHGETLYGVLGVYADRPRAFEGQERAVIGQLGEVVGHAITAIERKQALTSDEITELEFIVADLAEVAGLEMTIDGAITFDRAVPTGDDVFLQYGTVAVAAIGALEALVDRLSHVESMTIVDRDADTARFELRLSEPPVVSAVASHGGYIQQATIEDGNFHLTIHLPVTVEARRIIDVVQDTYSTTTLLRRRQLTRRDEPLTRFHQAVTADLTDRQRATLEAAYHAGFFEWPRDVTGEEVAKSLGIAPSTFAQHLRKGQRQVFESVFSTATSA